MAEFITTQEASVIIGVKVRRVRQLIKSGALKAVKFGRDWQIDRSSVEAYAEAHPARRETK